MDIAQIMRERIEQEVTTALGGSCSTSLLEPDSQSVFTLEMLEESIDKIESINEKPFKDLLRENNLDPEQDMIVFSVKAAEVIGLTQDNIPRRMRDQIKISAMVDFGNVYLFKKPDFEIKPYNSFNQARRPNARPLLM